MEKRFKPCSVQDCERNAHRDENGKKGFCSLHYERQRKHGNPFVVKRNTRAIDWLRQHSVHTGPDCLVWPFHIGKDGYGRAHYPGYGPITTASRLMCIFAHGEPPTPRHEAAHSCGNGNKGCVNPLHLYWATPAENHSDKIKHGTTNRGERQGRSKLTEENVLQIRQMIGSKTQAAIAKMYGVDQSTISDIRRRKRWGWLD